jgi:NAD-dependent protein deacetylase/lipoamidase
MTTRTADLATVAGWVRAAGRVTVLTGAGISTDSGIPDFRGPNGVWTRNPEAAKQVTLDAYVTDPAVRQNAWRSRRDHPAWTAGPNAGHRALVDLERTGRLHALVTQNIDGLHQRAGSRDVVEVHGSLRTASCLECGGRQPLAEGMPRCSRCDAVLKPDVVMFGELLPPAELERALELARGAGLLLVVGSSLAVYPVAGLPDETVSSGGSLAIVNRGETQYDGLAAVRIDGGAGEALGALLAELA